MAASHSRGQAAAELQAHEETFDGFVKWTVFCAAHILVILALMAIFLT